MMPSQGYLVFVDGYNVIKRHAPWHSLTLHEGRRRLIDLLNRTRWTVPVRRVTVVFDARHADENSEQVVGKVCIYFATPSADHYIQQAIRDASLPSRLVIISEDREIEHTAKSHGALRYPVSWLFRPQSEPRSSHGERFSEADTEKLASSVARQITAELERRWLG